MVGTPGDAVAARIEGVEAPAACDAGVLGIFAVEGGEFWRTENTQSWRVPRSGGESAVFERKYQRRGKRRGWRRVVFGRFVDDGDGFAVPLPVGVPGLRVLLVPFLLEDGGTVGGELDEEDAMDIGRYASATGVKAFELFSGLRRRGERRRQQGENRGRWDVNTHGGMVAEEGRRDNWEFWQLWLR